MVKIKLHFDSHLKMQEKKKNVFVGMIINPSLFDHYLYMFWEQYIL